MKDVLKPYLNQTIGINYERPFKIDSAKLTSLRDTSFTIVDDSDGYTHHFSYSNILQIIEHEGGIDFRGFLHKDHFTVIVKVGHLPENVMT